MPAQVVEATDLLATEGLLPQRTLLFDLDPKVAMSRGRSRGEDRLDAETLAFFTRVREGYLERARDEPRRFALIDSSGAKGITERQVRMALLPVLGDDP